jgi:FRG domain
MLEIFKCEAIPHMENPPVDNLEWLALAQHHSEPTRLLDWTTNPLIGLYFAVERDSTSDADVWCMGFASTNNCLAESSYLARRLTLRKVNQIYFSRHISPRMTNQSSCFTVHTNPTPLNQEYEDWFAFNRLRVPADRKAIILDELYNLGIHRGFIYPGLEGIALRLRYEVTNKHSRHTNEPE